VAGQQRTAVDFDAAGWEAATQAALARLQIDTVAKAQRLAHKAARNMRQLAPVDTGRLRNSIGVTEGADARGLYFDVGPTVDYAIHVEYGTSRSPAQPFVRPGVAEAVADGL